MRRLIWRFKVRDPSSEQMDSMEQDLGQTCASKEGGRAVRHDGLLSWGVRTEGAGALISVP